MGIYSDNFESTVVTMDGVLYSVAKMREPIDISEQKESPIGSIVLTHMVKGFEVDLFLLLDNTDDSFTFVHRVAPDVPLVVGVMDEEILRKATEVIQRADMEGYE
ncbi:hypothetical protein [Bacillus phage YungSlug]|nr:hypothetical protein [Bacillus phage YungSlug]